MPISTFGLNQIDPSKFIKAPNLGGTKPADIGGYADAAGGFLGDVSALATSDSKYKAGQLGSTIGGGILGTVGGIFLGPVGAQIGQKLGSFVGGTIGGAVDKKHQVTDYNKETSAFFHDPNMVANVNPYGSGMYAKKGGMIAGKRQRPGIKSYARYLQDDAVFPDEVDMKDPVAATLAKSGIYIRPSYDTGGIVNVDPNTINAQFAKCGGKVKRMKKGGSTGDCGCGGHDVKTFATVTKYQGGGAVEDPDPRMTRKLKPVTPLFKTAEDRSAYQRSITEESERALQPGDDSKYLTETSYHKMNGYDCINGICGLNKGKLSWSNAPDDGVYLSNPVFNNTITRGGEDYYRATDNFDVGDHLMFLTSKGHPHHSKMIYKVTTDDIGTKRYQVITNGGGRRFSNDVYSEDDLRRMATQNNSFTGNSPEIIVYRPGYALDKQKLEAQRLGSQDPEIMKAVQTRQNEIAYETENSPNYKYSIREDSPYFKDTPYGLSKAMELVNNEEFINNLVTKEGLSKDQVHDEILNMFGQFEQENKWRKAPVTGVGIKTALENAFERVIGNTKPAKNFSIGPGQIRFDSLSDDIKQQYNIKSTRDLFKWEKVIPLMIGMNLRNRKWMRGQGENLSERLIGEAGVKADDLKGGIGRWTPYVYRGLPQNPLKSLPAEYVNTQQAAAEALGAGSPDIKQADIDQYTKDNLRRKAWLNEPGSYADKVFHAANSIVERTAPAFEIQPKTLQNIELKSKIPKKAFKKGGMVDSVSEQGYSDGSPYADAPYLNIDTPNGLIDMRNTSERIMGIDETGYSQMMEPNNPTMYKFPGTKVKEIPMMKGGGWIKGAVNPAHKGYCTPMTKSTCTPRRKALARTFKKHHGFHEEGGLITNEQNELDMYNNQEGVPEGYHFMPDGTLMPDEAMYMQEGGEAAPEQGGQQMQEQEVQQGPQKQLINIEKGEILIDPTTLEVVREYENPNRYSAHKKDPMREPIGNFTMVDEGMVVIPVKYADRYLNGDILTRRSIVAEILKDQANNPEQNEPRTGNEGGAEYAATGMYIDPYADDYLYDDFEQIDPPGRGRLGRNRTVVNINQAPADTSRVNTRLGRNRQVVDVTQAGATSGVTTRLGRNRQVVDVTANSGSTARLGRNRPVVNVGGSAYDPSLTFDNPTFQTPIPIINPIPNPGSTVVTNPVVNPVTAINAPVVSNPVTARTGNRQTNPVVKPNKQPGIGIAASTINPDWTKDRAKVLEWHKKVKAAFPHLINFGKNDRAMGTFGPQSKRVLAMVGENPSLTGWLNAPGVLTDADIPVDPYAGIPGAGGIDMNDPSQLGQLQSGEFNDPAQASSFLSKFNPGKKGAKQNWKLYASSLFSAIPTAYGLSNALGYDPYLHYDENYGYNDALAAAEGMETNPNTAASQAALTQGYATQNRQLNNYAGPQVHAQAGVNKFNLLKATGELSQNTSNMAMELRNKKREMIANLKTAQGGNRLDMRMQLMNELRQDSANRSNLIQQGLSEGATNYRQGVMDDERIKAINTMAEYYNIDPYAASLLIDKHAYAPAIQEALNTIGFKGVGQGYGAKGSPGTPPFKTKNGQRFDSNGKIVDNKGLIIN